MEENTLREAYPNTWYACEFVEAAELVAEEDGIPSILGEIRKILGHDPSQYSRLLGILKLATERTESIDGEPIDMSRVRSEMDHPEFETYFRAKLGMV